MIKREQLITGLRNSLKSSGRLLLCCSVGPSGRPGWEYPAPFERIWCLFEIFVAISSNIPVIVQLAPAEAFAFRKALLDLCRPGVKRFVCGHLGAVKPVWRGPE